MPEWEAEIESIYARFRRFDLSQVAAAATTIYEMKMRVSLLTDFYDQEKRSLAQWTSALSNDGLVDMVRLAPKFLNPIGEHKDVVDAIARGIQYAEDDIAKTMKVGVTNSALVSLFTSKVSASALSGYRSDKERYSLLAREMPRAEAAFRLLREVYSESSKYSYQAAKLRDHLALAAEKKAAIERFEAKHGKAFAKAAAADHQTRGRATSLKRLVKKTQDCPYCGSDLGGNPHLDHIYPVSKGGLSIVENLIWCCSVCNSTKTDKGLMQFLLERRVPIDKTLARLHSLGKHV